MAWNKETSFILNVYPKGEFMSKKRIAAVAILLAILMIVLFSYDANAEDECNFDPPAYYSAEYIERFKEEDFYELDTVAEVPEVPVEEEMVTVTLSEYNRFSPFQVLAFQVIDREIRRWRSSQKPLVVY